MLYNPTGTYDYIPLATNAVRQALLVAANIEEPVQKYLGTQATSAVELYDRSLAASGLPQAGAEARGVNARSTTSVQDYRPDFMLTTTPVTATHTWDPETRRVLGAQVLCRHDVAEAANAISIAIQARFTIDQLANVDLFFQPNFCQRPIPVPPRRGRGRKCYLHRHPGAFHHRSARQRRPVLPA